ncbi:MAG TPA: cobyric acid synthase [Candidatus Binatia bacterium]|jgi:adenosylcobyric acid synthase|nr:cobyric acid synthase [Candidatus Binatia bacterium]
MRKRALMVLGTASHVGKSILTAGLGRIFSDDGYRVAPFKAQNMSLNSAATPDGREIGRAQALQAEACHATLRAEMNPILLKPSSDTSSQIILLGRIWGEVTASDYHTRRVEQLFPEVLESYRRLVASHDLILLEGAGSPAEINLREHDIVNLRMAHAADAACLLVGDIDRGGVFAALLGTMELLEPEDRARIRGFVINKFRGDESLLRPGMTVMEERLGLPCLGVVSFLADLGLDEEDGVALEDRLSAARRWRHLESGSLRALRIGVIALPHMANFTDFDPLAVEPAVSLAYLEQPGEMAEADLLVLPGSKQTLDDLHWLEHRGFVQELHRLHVNGVPIIGICGGFQMLGLAIEDPQGIENQGKAVSRKGLCLLPVRTVLRGEKTVQRVQGCLRSKFFGNGPCPEIHFEGYEIHVGETAYEPGARPLADVVRQGIADSIPDGAVGGSGRVFGTYVHGFFDNDDFRHSFIQAARAAVDLAPAATWAHVAAEREARIDRWAYHLRRSLDMNLIKSWVVGPSGRGRENYRG